MWSYILIVALVFVAYTMFMYVNNMKAKKYNTEKFEVAAADIKKLVDHLDVLSKDFSDTITKLKSVTESHMEGDDSSVGTATNAARDAEGSVNSEKATFSNKSKVVKKTKKAPTVDVDEEEDEDVDEVALAIAAASRPVASAATSVETFAVRNTGKRGSQRHEARREGFVNGVASKMAGNYMLLD